MFNYYSYEKILKQKEEESNKKEKEDRDTTLKKSK